MAQSRSKIDASLRSLVAKRPGWMAAFRTIDRFEQEKPPFTDDRAMVLLCVAVVEQALEEAILARCQRLYDDPPGRDKLFGSDGGAIAALSAKITTAHAMGLFGAYLRDDLTRLRHIRNTFAHARTRLSLASPPIAAALEFNLSDPNLPHNFKGAERMSTPRGMFLAACGLCMIHLYRVVKVSRRHRPRTTRNGSVFDASPPPSPRKPTRPRPVRPTRDDLSRSKQPPLPPPSPV